VTECGKAAARARQAANRYLSARWVLSTGAPATTSWFLGAIELAET